MKKPLIVLTLVSLVIGCSAPSSKRFVSYTAEGMEQSSKTRNTVREIERQPGPEPKQKLKDAEEDLVNGLFNAIVKSLVDLFRVN